jgi:hypothetical protein
MAIIDSKLEFSDAQTETNGSGSAAIAGTNEFEMASLKNAWGGSITNDIGEGNNGLVFNWQVATAVEASVIFICKAYSHTASGVSSGTLLGSVTFPAASVAGTKRTLRVPAGTVQKWVGITYSNTVDDWATAAFDAWLGLDTETPST